MGNKKHKREAFLASLQTFHSKLSDSLKNLDKESEMFSLEFVNQCFGLFPLINKAFAELVLELNYPVDKWDRSNTDEYLNYTLNMLKLLNSVSSCLSYLSQDRLSLLHALQLAESSPSLAAKQLKEYLLTRNLKEGGSRFKVEVGMVNEERKKSSGKECVVHEALVDMKSISLWVFGVLLSGLCSDVQPYIQMRKLAGKFDESLFGSLDTEVENKFSGKKGDVKEVKDVTMAAENLLGALETGDSEIAASELRSKLQVVQKLLQGLEKETNDMFKEILDARNNLLDILRLKK